MSAGSLRSCEKTENRKQRTENREQKTENRKQRTENRKQRQKTATENRGLRGLSVFVILYREWAKKCLEAQKYFSIPKMKKEARIKLTLIKSYPCFNILNFCASFCAEIDYQRFSTYSQNAYISLISSTVPSSRIALPFHLP